MAGVRAGCRAIRLLDRCLEQAGAGRAGAVLVSRGYGAGYAGENRWSLMSRAAPMTPAVVAEEAAVAEAGEADHPVFRTRGSSAPRPAR